VRPMVGAAPAQPFYKPRRCKPFLEASTEGLRGHKQYAVHAAAMTRLAAAQRASR